MSRLRCSRIAAHRLLRPFLGTGLLGGFTTFSTYAVQTTDLFDAGRPGLAAGYVLATLVGALIATTLGGVVADGLTAGPRPGRW